MNHSGKAAAVLMSGLLALTSMQGAAMSAETEEDLFVTGFEDGDVSAFSKRGDEDTSVIGTSIEDPHSGKMCMEVTERSQGWNGPSLSLEALGCKPGVQYVVSAWVKTQWYNNCMLSIQYTDAEGEQHYDNLTKAISEGGWVELPETKFSFSDDMQDVQIYIESSDNVNLYVDDFSLKPGPTYKIEDIAGLKDVYADYFKLGCACTAGELAPQSAKDLILKHHNSITLGNELKPENMLDQKATQAYLEETGDNTKPIVKLNGAARSILDFCRENRISVRGHVLVWHSQTPGWFFKDNYTKEGEWVDQETMTKRMEAYIKGVFEALDAEYADVDFYAWDVVNEAFLDDGSPRSGGMYDDDYDASGWTQIWGDNSFIETAFTFARKYAPKGCKLYYNDFNEYMTQKMDAIIAMAEDLKAKGLIDGIGMQSHLDVRSGSDAFPSVSMYEAAVAKYAETGLDIQITELDATVNDENFEAQATYYKGIMDVAVKYAKHISAVVIWGTTDDRSWRSSKTPLLFNGDFTAKPAYYEIVKGISYTTPAPAQTTTSEPLPPVSEGQRGDADCNGFVELEDAVLLAKVIAQAEGASITTQGSVNADVDDTAGIGNGDLIRLLQYLSGAIDKL